MNEHKQRFAKARAAFDRVRDNIKGFLARTERESAKHSARGYSGERSRPHVERETSFVHVSRPLVIDEKGNVIDVAPRGITYHRPELRRHELRKLKKRGLDLTGQTNTRQFEELL